jgi:excinuclease ABC subunit C
LEDLESEIVACLLQYYNELDLVHPDKIIINLELYSQLLEEALNQLSQHKLKVQKVSEKYKSLYQMTLKHAQESQRVRGENEDSVYSGLSRLQALLELKERPRILECYDVAIWQGQSPTASQIVFYEGKPDKKSYRHYHLSELPEGNNDFAMMQEVFRRRLNHGKLPDVFIVDGGKAQVSVVQKVLQELGIDVPLIGIAKAKDVDKNFRKQEINKSEERLIIPGRANPYNLNKCPSLFKIVVFMRDEAHRFSRRLHHHQEHKRTFKSWLDDIKGLSKIAKDKIKMNQEIHLNELTQMNVTELANYLDLTSKDAKIIYQFFKDTNL